MSANVVFDDSVQIIIFDNNKINKGGHNNVTTGVYTTPVAGMYQFFSNIRSTPKSNFHIRVDGTVYTNTIENYETVEPEYESERATVTVKLQADQRVQISTGRVASLS